MINVLEFLFRLQLIDGYDTPSPGTLADWYEVFIFQRNESNSI